MNLSETLPDDDIFDDLRFAVHNRRLKLESTDFQNIRIKGLLTQSTLLHKNNWRTI